MDKDARIKQLEAENASLKQYTHTLEQRIKAMEKIIEELQRQLGMNSQNSSKPPSSDPPDAPTAVAKDSGKKPKKRGARKGHKPHKRTLLPEDKVTRTVEVKPQACMCGCTHLDKTDIDPLRHQVIDLPPIELDVTEYRQATYRCRECGELIYQPLPDEIRRRHFGPGVLALVATLTGSLNISKRKALDMVQDFFGIPMSLGGLSACEAQLTQALDQPYQQVLAYMRKQPAAHADETGWPLGNRQKGWLWTLCGKTAAVFMAQAKRGQQAAQNLLGNFNGILHSDRWNGYNKFTGERQLCWAHLKRDFKALSEAKGAMGEIGKALSDHTQEIFHLRNRVRDGTLKWKTFQRRMKPIMEQVESLLETGADRGESLSGQCRRIFNQRQYLWTFVQHESVEPTNNRAERAVRQGVLWRKGSFGTQSDRGARYVERVLSACATCRLQERSIIDYLREVCHCYQSGQPIPSLINA